MSNKTKHSKFKNTGILFELLTRQIITDILAGKDDSFAKKLMFKYFSESTLLGKEFQLYNFITSQNVKTADKADRIVQLVLQSRSKLNEKELNLQKYNLIKEIKENIDINEFLKNKIPNYKLYASIYKLFENNSNDPAESYNIEELVTAKEFVLESMCNKKKPVIKESEDMQLYSQQSIDVKILAHKFLIENFNKKYSNLLPDQKKLIKEYITNISHINKFTEFVNSEYQRISKLLTEKLNLIENKVTKIKVKEAISQLSNKRFEGSVTEDDLSPLLNAYKLYGKICEIKK